MKEMIHHLIDGSGEGGAEILAARLAGARGRIWSLVPPHPDFRRIAPNVRAIEGAVDDTAPPGKRAETLIRRAAFIRSLKGMAVVAHDPASHEAAAIARATGGLPVIRVMHTSVKWTPDEHSHAVTIFSAVTSLYLCVERSTVDFARRHGARAEVFPQPIVPSNLKIRRRRGVRKTLRILFVGRLERAKGCDILIRAFKSAAKKIAATLTVVGDGPERPALENLARSLRLKRRIRFVGYDEHAGRRYGAADLVVIPSRGEGGSLVALESMACGTPVIGSAVGGLRELLTSYGLNRCLVPPENPAALARAICSFGKAPADYFSAISQIAQRVADEHDSRIVSALVKSAVYRAARTAL